MGAGAIPLGVSNTSELGLWVETDNRVWGRTNNPWDLRRTPGGSSGGEGALVASGASPIGLADDGLGSNRIPAAFCGVFCHKPTGGLVPLTGRYPAVYGKARRYTTIGPITRTATDLKLLVDLMRGPDGIDRGVLPIEFGSPADVDFTWKRVIICEDPEMPGITPSREVRRAVRRAAEVLEDRGAEIEEWRPRQFRHAADIWLSLHHEAYGLNHSFRDVLAEGERMFLPAEFAKLVVGRSRHTLPTLGLALTERLTRGNFSRIQRFCAEGRRLRSRLNTVLADGGVMLMPAWPTTAPKHGRTARHPRHVVYAAIHNVLGLPVTVAPMGRGRDGMPLAVQIVGAHGEDAVTIAAAQVLEEDGAGWTPPRLEQMRWDEGGE
jgi:fatty acid amide hydrolase 2